MDEMTSSANSAYSTYVLHCGKLFDGAAEIMHRNWRIIVEGDRIAAAGPDLPVPGGACEIDLSAFTVTPGLIDAHINPHVFQPGEWQAPHLLPADRSILAALHAAEKCLRRGFTTLRVTDGPIGAPDINRAALEGYFTASRIISARGMGVTGGSLDACLPVFANNPQMSSAVQPGNLGDGADFFKAEVRRQVKYGFDFIKLNSSGALNGPFAAPYQQQMDDEELSAAIRTAASLGRFVACQAYAPGIIRKLADLGANGIEHGSLIDGETAAYIAGKGVYLVPTFYADAAADARFAQQVKDSAKVILGSKLKLGFGSAIHDADPADSWRAYASWFEHGAAPFQALKAATGTNAEMIGWGNRLGRLAKGYIADIAAWQSDPSEDPRALEGCAFVMKGGAVISI